MLSRWLKSLLLTDYSKPIQRLRAAIEDGRISERTPIADCQDKLRKIIDEHWFEDSLDTVELDMAAEEKGVLVETVGDLLDLLEELQRDRK